MKFKVKRHLWIWALWILWHAFAIRLFQVGMYPAVVITVVLDIFLILPDASHLSYDITHRQLTVKRIVYHDISFPCDRIITVEKPTLLTLSAPGFFTMKDSLGAYKITYIDNKKEYKMPVVIIGAAENKKFLSELAMNVNGQVRFEISKLLKELNINGNATVV